MYASVQKDNFQHEQKREQNIFLTSLKMILKMLRFCPDVIIYNA